MSWSKGDLLMDHQLIEASNREIMMDEIVKYAFDSGALNNIILSVFFIWIMWFIGIKWWPEHVAKTKRHDEINKDIRIREIDADKEIKLIEVKGQIDVYQQALHDIKKMQLSIEGLQATFNDFLQNMLSQFLEDRRDLIDSQVFRNKDRKS